MFNDFSGFDAENNRVKISVPPTLLISSIGVLEDVSRAVSMDAKAEGDLVYVIGGPRKNWADPNTLPISVLRETPFRISMPQP